MNKIRIIIVCVLAEICFGLNDGLAPTPPMGWNSYNPFGHSLNETSAHQIADAMVSLGLSKLNYTYLTIDDGWEADQRDSEGRLTADPEKYPSGMKALADYVHGKGIKLGLYTDAGWRGCGCNIPGSLGHEDIDIQTFADWGIDYVKADNCFGKIGQKNNYNVQIFKSLWNWPSFVQDPPERERYRPIGEALKKYKSIHNITFEMCLYGFDNVEEWGPEVGHMWRTNTDPKDNWFINMWNIDVNDEDRLQKGQGPTKGWNYPGSLWVGHGGMSEEEYKTIFNLYCLIKSPLIIGLDIRNLATDDYAYKILTNEELLAINQDELGIQGRCTKHCSTGMLGPLKPFFYFGMQIWQGPLSDGAYVVVIVNRWFFKRDVSINWKKHVKIPDGKYMIRDLWKHKNIKIITVPSKIKTKLDSLHGHESHAFKLTPMK